MSLLAGAARVDITPPPGQPMAGFPMIQTKTPGAPADMSDYFGRQGVAAGVHDPLYARALVLDDGQRAIAIVAVDLVVVTADFTAAIRNAVHEAIGIQPDHLMIAASHTHAGPDLFRWTEGLDPAVADTADLGEHRLVAAGRENARDLHESSGTSTHLILRVGV